MPEIPKQLIEMCFEHLIRCANQYSTLRIEEATLRGRMTAVKQQLKGTRTLLLEFGVPASRIPVVGDETQREARKRLRQRRKAAKKIE